MDYGMAVPGVDLSHWDDAKGSQPIDYDLLVSRVGFVILRVGDGGATDRSFQRHLEGIANRVPVGTYLFCRPRSDPGQQAHAWANAVAEAERWGCTFPLGHWADLEANDNRTKAEVTAWLRAFFDACVQEFRHEVNIYSGRSWWNSNVDDALELDPTQLMWVARYPWQHAPPTYTPVAWPSWVATKVSAGTAPSAPRGEPVAMWQFSSVGNGTAVGAFRPDGLDCNLMDRAVFNRLVNPTPPDQVGAPANDPEAELQDTLEFVKREDENPATYLVIGGKYKLWMPDMDYLGRQATRLGIAPTIRQDTTAVNQAVTIGEEPG